MATPLATVADVEARIGRRIDDLDEQARVKALLADASGAVRAYCGRQFGAGTVTRRVRPKGNTVRLAEGVIEVTSVAATDGTELDFAWDGLTQVLVGGVNRFDVEPFALTAVDITYDYDTGPVPDVVRAVVAQMASRAYGVKADATGIQQQSIAGYSYSVGAVAASGAVGMLQQEKDALAGFRRIGGTARVYLP